MAEHKSRATYMAKVLVLLLLLTHTSASSSSLQLDVFYPDSGLDATVASELGGDLFSVGLSSLPYSLDIIEQYDAKGLFYFPWFGNYTLFVNNHTHRAGPDHWRATFPLPEGFTGDLYVILSMNFYGPTVRACEANFAMGTCQSRRSPWKVHIPESSGSSDSVVSLVTYPSFSTSGVGSSYTIFHDYYSATLDNYRDISVHVPWSVVENPISRSVGTIVLLDGDLSTTSLFASQGGENQFILLCQYLFHHSFFSH
jgi:hypothetical protein